MSKIFTEERYLIGALGQTNLFDFATSEKEAMQLAEELAEPGKPMGIWKLCRIGQRSGFQWEDPEQKAPKKLSENHHRTWTVEDDQDLRQYAKTKESNKEIAKKLGRTVRAVELRRYRLGY